MRNYQPKKDKQYQLDKILFRRIIYLVKDYDRMKELINEVVSCLPSSGGSSSNGQHSDSTLNKVIRIERVREECRAIEAALKQIPPEYQQAIYNKICREKPYPDYADLSTYSRWKCRFIYHIAEKLSYM